MQILEGRSSVSPASDVFSLASVLFEIASREIPYGKDKAEDAAKAIIAGQRPDLKFAEILDPDTEEKLIRAEVDARAKLRDVVYQAWAQIPSDRPSAAYVAEAINEIREVYLTETSRLFGSRV